MGDVAAALTWPLGRPLPRAGTVSYSSGVRRCLFGPVDRDKTQLYQEEQFKKADLENQTRWNFDFLNAAPIPGGRYSWVPKVPEKDSNGESEEKNGKPAAQIVEQTQLTKFFRKRKSNNSVEGKAPKRRRSST